MKCTLCKHGETAPGTTTVNLNQGESTIIIKGVPAEICTNCGEYYVSEEINAQLLRLAEEAVRKGAEVEIIRFAA
ncbi:MAG: type II toxin-antitoxin system MqsA family antitoxin [Candidatus Hydrogenedentes bacterium]|nr:type II toxin-antitoxin system MqsA family antitoxin [Candidatus Hydrogenedentota bacterium]